MGGGGEEASLPVSLSWALPAPPPPRWRAWLECKGGGVCAGSYRPRPFDEFDEFEDGLTNAAIVWLQKCGWLFLTFDFGNGRFFSSLKEYFFNLS